ncbi:nuclear condensin complex subunit Smc4 [Histoplasma capsulatum H143]|uniref:Structural maintenance of chromosomes protein n=1 Tax=Ajellomyces capsulatus (strain H143) TaxID=544712 RepID=C6HPA5_AJECH|nr:nuclear condensin complex subunit Smc4 [Histoplasma capsulatum H143]
MTSVSGSRPSRRAAAARKNFVVESSEDEAASTGRATPALSSHDEQEQEDEEEFTPVPKRPAAKGPTRRRTTANLSSETPQTVRQDKSKRTRRPRTGDDIEQSQLFDMVDESTLLAENPETPSKRPIASRKRRSPSQQHQRRESRMSSSASALSSLPTPESSASPEPQPCPPSRRQSVAPLADITETTVNEATPRPKPEQERSTIEMINPMSTTLEKPMDIVLKSRSLAVPTVEEPSAPKPRMVITHLVMTNFKSYAGRQVVGPFHVSFSSVVGPNGSGKSNVIDSLLFVFGFRASKMRQGKISALIHNSANFPDLQFCEVEVHFQEILDLPDGGHEIVPESQLIVSRRAFKNNSSKYYMNKKETNFTTVTGFLKDRGIDLDHKRFLILQGEVESIAQMKPKAASEHDDGLLEYLEDIIGTSKYKTPIEEAAAEVEALNEVCLEKNNRVQHVEKEKHSLEDKKNKAIAYIKDENELAEKQSALYQIYIDECNDNTRVTEEAILQMQELLNMELENHQGSEDAIKQLQRSHKRGAKEYEAMEKATQAMVKEMAKYDKESVKFEEKRKFLLGKQKKLEKAMQSSRLAGSECASLVEKHTDDIERKTAEIAELEKEMKHEEKELAAIREGLKGKTQGLSDQIAVKQKSLEPWNEKINEKQSAVAVAQSELDILREKRNAGAVAMDEANAKIQSIKATISSKTADLETRRAEKTELENEATLLETELKKFGQKEPEIRSRISSARQKADEARASLASTQNQGNVLAGLMRLKESGRIEGFHGRLGNLGTIDEQYDVAISTACPALENLVVDSVEVGQQCIDYLRKNNLGRANFILLDRLPQRDMSSVFTPDSVPRLFDLVKPIDPKFRPAFYSNLADAQRRVQELSAEHKPSKSDDSRSAALEKHISSLEKEIEKLHTETAGVEEEIQALQNKIMEIGGVRLRGQKAKVDGLKEQIDLLTEDVSNAEVSKSKNEKLRIKHEKARADAEGELEQVKKDLEKLNQDIESQENDVYGTKQKTEEAQEALETKKEELATLKAELDKKVAELNETRASEIEMKNKLEENQKVLAENQKRCRYWEEKLAKLSLQNISDLGEEQEAQSLPIYTKDELADMSKESLKAIIAALEEKTQNASVDLSVLGEYRRRVAEHESRSADLATALESRDNAKSRLDTLRSLRLTGFMEGFSTISLRLKEMYQMITMGGNAELELVDSLDPFSEGILFSVMPPKKSWKNIGNLSGGEKTLSSLALVFALHHYRPTPLYVMDEIDAALDFRNVSIVASYIKERTKNAQFIVISLRNNMFELASRLVGVYKVNHMTKSVTVENKDYIALAN